MSGRSVALPRSFPSRGCDEVAPGLREWEAEVGVGLVPIHLLAGGLLGDLGLDPRAMQPPWAGKRASNGHDESPGLGSARGSPVCRLHQLLSPADSKNLIPHLTSTVNSQPKIHCQGPRPVRDAVVTSSIGLTQPSSARCVYPKRTMVAHAPGREAQHHASIMLCCMHPPLAARSPEISPHAFSSVLWCIGSCLACKHSGKPMLPAAQPAPLTLRMKLAVKTEDRSSCSPDDGYMSYTVHIVWIQGYGRISTSVVCRPNNALQDKLLLDS